MLENWSGSLRYQPLPLIFLRALPANTPRRYTQPTGLEPGEDAGRCEWFDAADDEGRPTGDAQHRDGCSSGPQAASELRHGNCSRPPQETRGPGHQRRAQTTWNTCFRFGCVLDLCNSILLPLSCRKNDHDQPRSIPARRGCGLNALSEVPVAPDTSFALCGETACRTAA